ncbi:MAG TPA: hypothetical protein VGM88_35270 [Kofleriaceae bacterium]
MLRFWGTSTAVLLGLAASAQANPDGTVPSVGEAGRTFLVHLDYDYESDSAGVSRETPSSTGDGPIGLRKDLKSSLSTHTLTAAADVAIYDNAWLTFGLPITIAQSHTVSLADGVSRDDSSTVESGFLPAAGYDAHDPNTPPGGATMFRGVTRRGVGELRAGFGVAPMNQAHDDTKPSWKLGAEARIPIGKTERFDEANPGGETGVSDGVYKLRLWTTVDRRYSWAEGHFESYWQIPLARRDSSLFQDPGFGAKNTLPGQQAGASGGVELYAYQDGANTVGIDLSGGVTAYFEGRDYSELWEIFSLAGDTRTGGPLILDSDPVMAGVQAMSYPGISNIENYVETRAKIGVRAHLGPHVQFAATGEVLWKSDHDITFADAGVDLPTCASGQTAHCETSNNDLVNPGTVEVNPLHNQAIDLTGQRYRSIENLGVRVGVEALVSF